MARPLHGDGAAPHAEALLGRLSPLDAATPTEESLLGRLSPLYAAAPTEEALAGRLCPSTALALHADATAPALAGRRSPLHADATAPIEDALLGRLSLCASARAPSEIPTRLLRELCGIIGGELSGGAGIPMPMHTLEGLSGGVGQLLLLILGNMGGEISGGEGIASTFGLWGAGSASPI